MKRTVMGDARRCCRNAEREIVEQVKGEHKRLG